MKLDINKLFAAADRTVMLDYDEGVGLERADIVNTIGPAHACLKVSGTEDGILIEGSIEQKLLVQCYRCLKPFEYALKAEVDEDISFSDDDDNILSGDKKYIDMGEVLRSSIYLSLPMRFECSENCEGLDIEREIEDEEDESDCHGVDPRFAVLKRYFERD